MTPELYQRILRGADGSSSSASNLRNSDSIVCLTVHLITFILRPRADTVCTHSLLNEISITHVITSAPQRQLELLAKYILSRYEHGVGFLLYKRYQVAQCVFANNFLETILSVYKAYSGLLLHGTVEQL